MLKMRWKSVDCSWRKAACTVALLVSSWLLVSARDNRELVVSHASISEFPSTLGNKWNGRIVPIDSQIIQVLGAGDFAERNYEVDPSTPPIDLFIGYFPSQRTGVSIHSPKNCLPGSGWAPIESKYIPLRLSGERKYNVNEYLIQKGEQRELVLYWYQTHGRIVANEYAAKFYLVADSIRMHRSDAALIRIVTPIAGNEPAQKAEERALQFAQALMPNLERYIPA